MGADHIVHLECEPKKHFGGGDAVQGTIDILSKLKARDRGNMIAELAKRDGKPVEEMSVTVVLRRDGKEEQQQVTQFQPPLVRVVPLLDEPQRRKLQPLRFAAHNEMQNDRYSDQCSAGKQ